MWDFVLEGVQEAKQRPDLVRFVVVKLDDALLYFLSVLCRLPEVRLNRKSAPQQTPVCVSRVRCV